uniref:Uncharacterized protein n=1 Tax=Nelumbo nucifera TaxID=4432 RepID=A0A822Z748_NELNU|nr:TPA_asm: hypothetical protein HUJ06_014763 [Nelumbo nucifera]
MDGLFFGLMDYLFNFERARKTGHGHRDHARDH